MVHHLLLLKKKNLCYTKEKYILLESEVEMCTNIKDHCQKKSTFYLISNR